MSSSRSQNEQPWKDLVAWVKEKGGFIHDSLSLIGEGPSRGVIARKPIANAETLIRLPHACVISGAQHPVLNSSEKSQPVSNWLKCLAAHYRAKQADGKPFQAYFDSLPDDYETLFQWSDEEVETYLAGTTIGAMVCIDRKEESMRKRYELAIRPRLQECSLLPQSSGSAFSDDEYSIFLQACMCISTRGFHLMSSNNNDNQEASKDNSYPGPFLLPVIDLLNHDPSKKCTTLQHDDTNGFFFMKAERDILSDEEVYHSYGDSLTAAQLLQTFGFVPASKGKVDNPPLTPAGLKKVDHLLAACRAIKASSFPKKIQGQMKDQAVDEDESWEINEIPERPMDEDTSDDWLISFEDPMPDELVTFVVLQFLPADAYDEMCPDGRISTWLDKSIREDFYLGKLVCQALREAIRMKCIDYRGVGSTVTNIQTLLDEEQAKLSQLESPSGESSASQERAKAGTRIRVEEMLCLNAISQKIQSVEDILHVEDDSIYEAGPSKKAKKE